ncbi:hypothetical protein ONZ45_g15508 [Pleurotus djamor]|nr:hypothetical protein ONZ45_g15508 [Pleurotus djamor]
MSKPSRKYDPVSYSHPSVLGQSTSTQSADPDFYGVKRRNELEMVLEKEQDGLYQPQTVCGLIHRRGRLILLKDTLILVKTELLQSLKASNVLTSLLFAKIA